MNERLERLYDQHAAALRLYARTWCRFPDDAVQEAMVELARQPEMPSEPVGWLYRTVRFRAINLHRSEHRRCEREQSVAAQSDPFFTPNPSEALEGAEVELVLQRLSERNQEIVVARVWGGLSFEQIGELTRLSSSTVHRHYQASLEEMKKYLDDPQNSPPLTRNLS